MHYLGHVASLDFMQAGDTIFTWCLDRWVRYCSVVEWFTSTAGRFINKVFFGGYLVSLKEAR